MKVEYKVIPDEGDYNEGCAAVVRVGTVDGAIDEEVGWIGGEPEDNTYYRTYAWIVGALNDAYKLGVEHGSATS